MTLIGIVIAAWMIVWQMGRQHRSSLELQRERARMETRATIYGELQKKISAATNAEISAANYARMIPIALENYQVQILAGIQNVVGRPLVRQRAPEFLDLNSTMTQGVIELISTFENYEIAVPEFGVFQDALSSAMYDAQESFNELHRTLLLLLPIDMREQLPEQFRDAPNADYVPGPPSDEQLADLQRLVNAYIDATDDIGSYLYDLKIESQNTLLNDLFPRREVLLRKPLDPRMKVVTSTNAEELRRYFREETPWGRSAAAAEERVRAGLAEGE